MSVVIGIACEDNGHFKTVTRLVDELAVARHDWLDGILEHCRRWVGIHEGQPWYKYDTDDTKSLEPLKMEGQTIRPHGHIAGERLKPEAGMWRKVLLMFCGCNPRPDAVILVRDMDGYPARREGAEQVRDRIIWPFQIVIAAPQPEIEAWWVSGFVPVDDAERLRLDEIRRQVSFDPTTESHRLTSHPNEAPTDAKRVLDFLCGADADRERACLDERAIWGERGTQNGYAHFVIEVESRLAPVFVARK